MDRGSLYKKSDEKETSKDIDHGVDYSVNYYNRVYYTLLLQQHAGRERTCGERHYCALFVR